MEKKDRYDKFLDELNGDMKRRGIKKIDVSNSLGAGNKNVVDFLNGKSLSLKMMKRVLEYVDNPENWKK